MTTAAMSTERRDSLTSFGFLDDADAHQESPFAFNSLFSRVKSALGAATSASEHAETTPTHAASNPLASSHSASASASTPYRRVGDESSSVQGRTVSHGRKVSNANSARALSALAEIGESSRPRRSSPSPSQRDQGTSPNRATKPDPSVANARGSAGEALPRNKATTSMGPPSSLPSTSSGSRPGGATARTSSVSTGRTLPLPLRTIAPAPTVTYVSPAHAVTHRITAAGGQANSVIDDNDSVVADDGDYDGGDASRDQLTSLRNSGIDNSHWAAHGWSNIPGFPLSKDILADDARSVHSTSSRFPRSESFEESHYSSTPARTGSQTSADAIIKRMRGEGLSRKFWMADENAKECRECLTVFTPFRRKHHCRICGQIFCGRCASHIIKGTRFGYDGMVRVCNLCMRMLDDYDRHDPHGHHRGVVGATQAPRLARAPSRALKDKDLISAPLEAQIQSPQAQFAANHLFASAGAATAAFALGSHHIPSNGSALDPRDSAEGFNLYLGPPSAEASPRQGKAKPESNETTTSATTTAAPFRKGLADDELAVAPPAEEAEAAFVGDLIDIEGSKAVRMEGQDANVQNDTGPRRLAFPIVGNGLGIDDGSAHNALATASTSSQTADFPRLRLVSDAASRRPSYRTRLRSRNALVAETMQATAAAAVATNGDAALLKAESKGAPSPVLTEERSEGSVDGTVTSDPGKEFRSCMLNITPALLASSISMSALQHLTTMMEQTLVKQNVPRTKVWLDVLLPIVLTAVSKVKPNPRESSRMDVRDLIKIKRIPGGKPTDCEYVHGFVCSKNVATKRMAKSLPLTNARIMVVKFPLDYHRGPNQFMSLEPLMAQEHEFIRILVARVVALRPQIVVVEKTVSRLALDLLERAGVVVVWSLKPSAIEAISRCTQADIITSIDRLSLDPKLGRCHSFSVETFEHSSFPEMRKSFMRFEGTPKDLGCTIVLRGANGKMLSNLKRILELMIFVAYNLRLEEHIMKDEGAAMDTIYHPSICTSKRQAWRLDAVDLEANDASIEALEEEYGVRADAESEAILSATRHIQRALDLYQQTLVSSSACIELPPPFPVARLKQENDLLLRLKRQREAEELEKILKDEGKLITGTNGQAEAPLAASKVDGETTPVAEAKAVGATVDTASTETMSLSESSSTTKDPLGKLDMGTPETPKVSKADGPVVDAAAAPANEGEGSVGSMALPETRPCDSSLAGSRPSTGVSESAPSTPIPAPAGGTPIPRPSVAAESLSEVPTRTTSPAPMSILSSSASTSSRSTLQPSSLAGRGATGYNAELVASLRSPSDVAREAEYGIVRERHAVMLRRWKGFLEVSPEKVSPFNHQRMCMLSTNFCAVTQKPCEEPSLATVEFYGHSDETLGRHLEELARNSSRTCPVKGCGRANVLHYRSYVHNRVRIQVFLERFVCPIPGEENRLLSWSYCKVCENATPVAIVTPESWSFSFAKYLELYFYRHASSKTKLCDHDFYRDQVRYFAYQNLAIRFHSEEVELYEVSVPSTRLFISPEAQSNLKNEESVTFSRKNSAYWDSVMARIKALSADACSDASGPNRERNRLLLSERIKKCEADRREIEAMVTRTYRQTAPVDVLCLNSVQRALQEKVVKWDLDFIEFEKSLIPSEKDLRRITTNHLKRLFAEKDGSEKGSEISSGGLLPPAAEIDESTAEAASGSASEKPLQPREHPSTESPFALDGSTSTGTSTSPDAVRRANDVQRGSSSMGPTSPSSPNRTRPIGPPRADDDTDAADLSPSDSRMGGAPTRLTPSTAPASPTYSGVQPRQVFYSNVSRADESSCTENEIARSVSNLVRRFEGPRRPTPSHSNSSGAPASRVGGEARRPSMRRGRTEETLSSQARSSRSGGGAASPLVTRTDSLTQSSKTPIGADEREGGPASNRPPSPQRRASQTSQSRVPRVKRTDSSNSVTSSKRSGNVTPTGPSAPPSSFKPPRGEGLKAGPRPIIGRTGNAMARARGSDSDRAGYTNGRQDSTGAGLGREGSYIGGGGSRVPVARRSENGPGTRSRVSTIAKHFDRISREAERERERQHRLLVAQRAKRARPVAMTRAKVEVFSSIKEAVRDDESDRESVESGDDGASAADNEDEGEGDDDSDVDDADRDSTAIRADGLSSTASSFNRRAGKKTRANAIRPDQPTLSSSSSLANAAEGAPSNGSGPVAGEDTLKGKQARPALTSGEGRLDASQSTIKAQTAGSPDLGSASAGYQDSAPERALAHRQLAQTAAGSELESDAQSIATSSVTGSAVSSTLPSYLRSGIFADSDSSVSLERSFLKTLSGFWAFRSGEMVPLEYPMLNSEHVFGDSEIIFREDEPSSIVAFTLSSMQYNDRLKTLQIETTKIKEKEVAFMPGHESADDGEGWDVIDIEGRELESVLKKEGTHFRCEFESGSTRLWCKILFAEQFDALRRSCSCEQSFIESLSRCLKWDSSGGKSGSAFLKTRDDRLVVKQLSRFEMDTFSKFAPQYFQYMSQCFSKDRRSTLAKIFGCFRIGFRNPQTGKSLKMDCLVMENLFYGREVTKIYDLKGSMRNRHIQETGRANEVLLDENLVEVAHQSPLFLREHSKRLLRSALHSDSLFLADMNVMDYSLVVGVDKKKQELVVGIIDFVRTFTWDKRVESFVKETALLGGAGKGEPTIITPRQYRTRFLGFLDKSFLLVPDCWIGDDWTQEQP